MNNFIFIFFTACKFYLVACGAHQNDTDGKSSYLWDGTNWHSIPPLAEYQLGEVSYIYPTNFPVLAYGPHSSPTVFSAQELPNERVPNGFPDTRVIIALRRNYSLITSLSLTQNSLNIQIFQLAKATLILGCYECQVSTPLAEKIIHHGFSSTLAHYSDLTIVGGLFRQDTDPLIHQPSTALLTWDMDIQLFSRVLKKCSVTLGRIDELDSSGLSVTILNLNDHEQQ